MEELKKDEKKYIIDQLIVVLDSLISKGVEITVDNWQEFKYEDYYQLDINEFVLIKNIIIKLSKD